MKDHDTATNELDFATDWALDELRFAAQLMRRAASVAADLGAAPPVSDDLALMSALAATVHSEIRARPRSFDTDDLFDTDDSLQLMADLFDACHPQFSEAGAVSYADRLAAAAALCRGAACIFTSDAGTP